MIKIEMDNWKYFKITDIFKVEKAKNVVDEIASEEAPGFDVPYITRTEYNNGCKYFCNKSDFVLEKGNCITIGGEGANVYYQPFDFISGNNITKIYSKFMNENSGLFIVSILKNEKYRYSYNRAFNKKCVENTLIKLPAKDDQPDWEWMEKYIKTLKAHERERVVKLLV